MALKIEISAKNKKFPLGILLHSKVYNQWRIYIFFSEIFSEKQELIFTVFKIILIKHGLKIKLEEKMGFFF